jgi:putative ABC transport system ATP-binding protein
MLHLQNVDKEYSTRRTHVKALSGVDLIVEQGQFVVISGPSGCGKTTLLMTVGGMLRPTRGKVIVNGSYLYDLSNRARARFRGRKIGFVFQTYHLVPYLTVLENVVLAGPAGGQKADSRKAEELLNRFGISERLLHKPSQLSTGERQRTAIARALFNDPEMILADEPTGNLDVESSASILEYLSGSHESGRTVILVTHDRSIGNDPNVRKIAMNKGRLIDA